MRQRSGAAVYVGDNQMPVVWRGSANDAFCQTGEHTAPRASHPLQHCPHPKWLRGSAVTHLTPGREPASTPPQQQHAAAPVTRLSAPPRAGGALRGIKGNFTLGVRE